MLADKRLAAEYGNLLHELFQVKSHIMGHSTYHDPNVDGWVNKEILKSTVQPSFPKRVESVESMPSPADKRPSLPVL
jgi:hypothetical protein